MLWGEEIIARSSSGRRVTSLQVFSFITVFPAYWTTKDYEPAGCCFRKEIFFLKRDQPAELIFIT
jgi:hypothetical protein